jgi:hypothetical protein
MIMFNGRTNREVDEQCSAFVGGQVFPNHWNYRQRTREETASH